jgi:hypothetical protein
MFLAGLVRCYIQHISFEYFSGPLSDCDPRKRQMNEAKINQFMKKVDLFARSCLIQQKEICLCGIYTKIHYFFKLLFDFLAGIWRIPLQFLPLIGGPFRWLGLVFSQRRYLFSQQEKVRKLRIGQSFQP